MDNEFPQWLRDLRDEYTYFKDGKPIVGRTVGAQARLLRVFSDQPDEIMEEAIRRYLLKESWFPKVVDLSPYIQDAERAIQQQVYPDEVIYTWELERGSMPSLKEVEEERALALSQIDAERVQEILEAYERARSISAEVAE